MGRTHARADRSLPLARHQMRVGPDLARGSVSSSVRHARPPCVPPARADRSGLAGTRHRTILDPPPRARGPVRGREEEPSSRRISPTCGRTDPRRRRGLDWRMRLTHTRADRSSTSCFGLPQARSDPHARTGRNGAVQRPPPRRAWLASDPGSDAGSLDAPWRPSLGPMLQKAEGCRRWFTAALRTPPVTRFARVAPIGSDPSGRNHAPGRESGAIG